MKIIVCMKQVPAEKGIEIDPETGALKRSSGDTRTNPYDLFALETALQLREKLQGEVTVLTMGPVQAEKMIRDSYAMGVDHGVLLSDRRFAGADVLATSYALSQAIQAMGDFDLIICGKQTTDGDTSQVGPAIAEHLSIPHAAWVDTIVDADGHSVTVSQDIAGITQISKMQYPCLITVNQDSCVPRLPSYILKKKTAEHHIQHMDFGDMPDPNTSHYGFAGSPTAVVRIFAPDPMEKQVYLQGDAQEKTEGLFSVLTKKKLI